MEHDLFHSRKPFGSGKFYSLPQLERMGVGPISRLPFSIRILLESVLRNYDEVRINQEDIVRLATWRPDSVRSDEVPFLVSRILLQDFTGVPLLVDLASMRSAVARLGRPVKMIEPMVPVDLVIDHSVQVDFSGSPNALQCNMEMEFQRNRARYQFLQWGAQAYKGFNVVPPGIGICHQVNLEYLAKVVREENGLYYPDTLVGTDSHTPMINGLGVLGWGVGGIEAEAGMLGQPIYFLTPDVVAVHMTGKLQDGTTATDLVLHVTEMLRRARVVGKFVEFCGPGVTGLPVPDRATIGNMAPEYGATIGLFPVDEMTCTYLRSTGRTPSHVNAVRDYYIAQQMFGVLDPDQINYSSVLELNLNEIEPSVAGPKRPQDRIPMRQLKQDFIRLLQKPQTEGGYGKSAADIGKTYSLPLDFLEGNASQPVCGGGDQASETMPDAIGPVSAKDTSTWTESEMLNNRPTPHFVTVVGKTFAKETAGIRHGSAAIAAITSCTNTSNPSVMIAAGLLAKKAVGFGIMPPPYVKTSLAPGSRIVSEYLAKTGLQEYLSRIGFDVVGYGCTTCIGNSGPLDPAVESAISQNDLILASVLSGNRNFEARIHQSIKANFLMSPPLVVAFALAGRVDIDMTREPLSQNPEGQDVYLRDIWPAAEEIEALMHEAFDAETYRRMYADFARQNPLWDEIPVSMDESYHWDKTSSYIREPPYFLDFRPSPLAVNDIENARPLAIFGDSVTTDHISPAGAIKPDSPAGIYLQELGVSEKDFNSYGSRRGNHHVMVRGTFANVRIRNLMILGVEGGVTVHHPGGKQMSIYEAACKYQESSTPLVIIAGREYGTGSSRDWAAKGTLLLGVRAVIAQSYERIHRSNLVGMGVLPCQFDEGMSARSLALDGSETFDLLGISGDLLPRKKLSLVIHRNSGKTDTVKVILRIDTPIEVEYYRYGGILPYVLSQLLNR